MAWKDHGVGKDDIFAAAGCEDNDFGNVIGSKRLDISVSLATITIKSTGERYLRVDSIGLGLVAVVTHNGKVLVSQ